MKRSKWIITYYIHITYKRIIVTLEKFIFFCHIFLWSPAASHQWNTLQPFTSSALLPWNLSNFTVYFHRLFAQFNSVLLLLCKASNTSSSACTLSHSAHSDLLLCQKVVSKKVILFLSVFNVNIFAYTCHACRSDITLSG